MNKAVLVALGMFTLMNSVVSLVSRQAEYVEMVEPISYTTPADSSVHVEEYSADDVVSDSKIVDEQLEHMPESADDMQPPSKETNTPVPPSTEESQQLTKDTDISDPGEQVTNAPPEISDQVSPPVAVVVPPPSPGTHFPEPIVPVQEENRVEPVSLSPADSLLLLIPELAWPDSHRTRREITPEVAQQYPPGQFVPRTVENSVWGVGEYLEFSIDYGFYTAGTATMSVLSEEMVNGANSYHIQTTARSNDFISKFYKVRDQVNSYIDTEGIFSRRIEKILREGDYRSDRFVDFYPDRQIAVSTVDKHPVTEIPLYVQDVLSSLYLIRTYPLEVGQDFNITTYADGKVYPLRVTVHKMETIKVPAGKFRCYVVEPFLQSDGIFRQKGKLTVWLTADEHRIPVKMTSKIVIGSIGTNLTTYRLGATE